MNKTEIDVAYLPLVDSAPFIVAEHLGFFRRSDLRVHLHKEVSWAIVRDKLAVGGLAAWRHGGMAAWRLGGLAAA